MQFIKRTKCCFLQLSQNHIQQQHTRFRVPPPVWASWMKIKSKPRYKLLTYFSAVCAIYSVALSTYPEINYNTKLIPLVISKIQHTMNYISSEWFIEQWPFTSLEINMLSSYRKLLVNGGRQCLARMCHTIFWKRISLTTTNTRSFSSTQVSMLCAPSRFLTDQIFQAAGYSELKFEHTVNRFQESISESSFSLKMTEIMHVKA